MIASSQSDLVAPAESSAGPRTYRHAKSVLLQLVMAAALLSVNLPGVAQAVQPTKSEPTIEERVQALIPDLAPTLRVG